MWAFFYARIITPISAQKQKQVLDMFTLTIKSNCDEFASIREWPTVDVIRSGSHQFKDIMKSEKSRIASMFENCENPPDSPENEAEFLVNQYKAVLRSVCGEFVYLLSLNESAFVMNASGKTVATVK